MTQRTVETEFRLYQRERGGTPYLGLPPKRGRQAVHDAVKKIASSHFARACLRQILNKSWHFKDFLDKVPSGS